MNHKAVVLAFLWFPSALWAAPPPSLEIAGSSLDAIPLTARDRANGSWILETSEDLIHWRDSGQRVHVRNSELPLHFAQPPGKSARNIYFRLASLPVPLSKTFDSTLTLQETPYAYSLEATPPATLGKTVAAAKIDDRKATLGRVLFHDRRLSLDNSVSCASCHRQENAFADRTASSIGHRGVPTVRNSVSLQHGRTYMKGGGIFWDGRGQTLDAAVLDPIVHPDEMGLSLAGLREKIDAEPYYKTLFLAAYGTVETNSTKIGECLADFIESMASFRSKYDTGSLTAYANFTAEEKLGRSIFSSRCGSCHPPGSFTNGAFGNNGLDLQSLDRGRAALTGLATHEGQFRIPSLRQVALTAPYMHDGRFASLREVIDFYDHEVRPHPNLTRPLTASSMNLKEAEKLALEAFLQTLTDSSVVTNPAFSDPFRSD